MTATVLDCETTGLEDEDRVFEIAVVDLITSATLFHRRFDPQRPLHPKSAEVTGVCDDDLRGLDLISQHLPEIKSIVECSSAVLGYNVGFDKKMIDLEARRAGLSIAWPIVVCAKRMWDVYEPRPERNLMNAYRRFVHPDGFDGAHGALADTRATRDVVMSQLRAFDLGGVSWEEIDPERRLWWGPSGHVIVVDGVLTVNFGKHEGRPVDELDVGYWSWVIKKDFPDHVVLMAMKIVELGRRLRGSALRSAMSEWGAQQREKMK